MTGYDMGRQPVATFVHYVCTIRITQDYRWLDILTVFTHHHHMSVMELGHLLTRSSLT